MTRTTSILSFAFSALVATASAVHAQGRWEVGGQFSVLQPSDSASTNAGIGARVAWHAANWVSAEAEVNYFASERFEWDGVPSPAGVSFDRFNLRYNRQRLEAFFGPKIGHKWQRFGLFGKVRPGFTHLTDDGVECIGDVCALALIARPQYRTEFALDLGGVAEFYPTSRTVVRADLGTRMIRHRSSAPPCQSCSTQNFSSSFGAGYRF